MWTLERLGLGGALISMLALGGCATTTPVTVVPSADHHQETWTLHPEAMPIEGADGKVQVAAGAGGQQDLRLEVQNLKPAGVAFEGTKDYVVWLRPADGLLRKVGVLRVDGNERGELAAAMPPFRAFEVVVTAEPHPEVVEPAGSEVMETTVALPA
ncbi:MAG TPA: hypothetical protein VKZ18_23295 [Polyangia bacterium]|nr:hypothetical protein [Polyangia bacterium]